MFRKTTRDYLTHFNLNKNEHLLIELELTNSPIKLEIDFIIIPRDLFLIYASKKQDILDIA